MKNLNQDEQLRLYEQILINMASGLYMVRIADGEIVYANPTFEKMFGYDHGELPGLHMSILIAPDHQTPEKIAHEILQTLLKKGNWHGEIKNQNKDGSHFWCHADISTFNHSIYGKVFIASHSDITERICTRIKLKESEERLKNFSDLTTEGILIHKNGVCIDINKAFEDVIGFKREELIGKNLIELLVPKEFHNTIYKNLQENNPDKYEILGKRKDGVLIPIEIGGRRELNYKGEKVFVSIARDVTEKRKYNLKVKKSEADLVAQIENTSDSIWSVDKNYKITITNSVFFRNFKIAFNHELRLGDRVLDYLPDDLKTIWKERYDRALAGEHFSVIDKFDMENIPQYVETAFNPVVVENKIEGAACFTKDITKQKQTEKALKISENKFKKLSEFSPASISIQRTNKYLYVNKAWEILTGYTKEEALKISPMQIIHPDCVDEIRQRSDSRLKGEDVIKRYDLKLLSKSKEIKWVDISFSLIDYEGQIASLGVCFDITELKKAKEALMVSEQNLKKANTAKNKFFSIIAHDLRSPFSTILGFSNILNTEYDNLNEEQRKSFIKELSSTSNRTFFLLENLLNWARAQQGGILINKESFNLKEFIDLATESHMNNANHKKIVVNNNVSNDIFIHADKYTILTVLRNLFNNAIKYTYPEGNIDFNAHKEKQKVSISITDSGIGIAEDMLDKLFILHENCTTPGTHNEPGTGLGLVLCKEFVELNGGTISVTSSKGKGSIFNIILPL
ncbi:PAS domain S-box protein [Labilibacter sediminis]|nr:PAS domain S-box protein [Labilibacter sediminis]